MSNILDQALNLYIQERIKSQPLIALDEAINRKIPLFNELCERSGLKRDWNAIVNGVMLPFIEAVREDLKSQIEKEIQLKEKA